MKKLSALLNTPARAAIAVGMIMLVSELLIMIVIESISHTILKAEFLEKMAFEFIDPILLIILVSPALLLLIFKPMRAQQAVLERQLDELRRFHNLSIGRELRMKELVEENTALRHPLSVEPAGDIPVTSAPRDAADQYATTQPTEQNQLNVLLFMLEDLENAHKKIDQAHQEWIAALDVVDDPIFLHDKQFRILRCNKAYQQLAGIPFKQIIGQPYYEVFPKNHAPQPCCLCAMEKAKDATWEDEVAVGDAIYRSRAFSIHDEQGAYLHSVHTLEDITEKRQADAQLRLFRDLLDQSSDDIFIVDPATSRFLDVNETACRDLCYTRDELLQRGVVDIQTVICDAAAWQMHVQELSAQGSALLEFEALRKDGSRFPVEANLRHISAVNRAYIIAVVRDITERKKAEQQLQLTQFAMDNAYVEIYWLDKDARIHYVNKQACATLGYTQEELLRLSIPDVDPLFPEAQWKAHWQSLQHDKTQFFETMHKRKDGVVFPVEVVANYVKFGDLEYNVAFTKDITERKRAEDALQKSKDLLQSVVENAPARIFWKDRDSRYLGCNTRFAKDAGHSRPDELTGKTDFEMGWKDQAELYRADDKAVMESGNPKLDYEEPSTTPDGNTIWLRTSKVPLRDESNQVIGILGIYEDITERKRAEVAIQHANRALATLSAVNRTLVHATSENELLQAICQAIVEQRCYRMAWVGYKQHDESKSLKIMAHAGHDEGYLDTTQISWAENERGMGPTGRAIRSRQTQVCRDIANDPAFLPWRDAALQRGYRSSIALPLADGEAIGALMVYADEPNAFDDSETALLEEMAGDLAFGVRSLHTRRERDLALVKNRQHLVQLQDSLEDTVRAIATIVEMRDPYTAGHQVRVADLAVAIAKQMGLPEEQVHAIHLAGTVHDLGKIKIPAEILSKPGKITDLEFGLIKVHPQAGYDILKGINFPWPIALMVLQHHERFDGSGYPQGLKGEAILLEARILGVADVVEAMSSHRPYRPGLGIEIALAEITRQRGGHFDPAVVDACLALFREQHYSFKS